MGMFLAQLIVRSIVYLIGTNVLGILGCIWDSIFK